MNQCQLTATLVNLDAIEDEKELAAIMNVIDQKKKKLAETKEKRQQEKHAAEMSELCYDFQNALEQKAELLFDNFKFGQDTVYFTIKIEDLISFLGSRGYSVNYIGGHDINDDTIHFTMESFKYNNIKLDDMNDVLIPMDF